MSSLETEDSQLAATGQPVTLTGLAALWEADVGICQRARQDKSLLSWTKPAAVGVANMSLVTIQRK